MKKLEDSLKQLTETIKQVSKVLEQTEEAVTNGIDEISAQGTPQDIIINLQNALKDAKQGKSVEKYIKVIKTAQNARQNP